MVAEISKDEQLARAFKALGDPTRLRIFQMLRCCETPVALEENGDCRPAGTVAEGSLSVGDVCCQVKASMSTVSHHLRELRLAGLIVTEKRGRTILCSVAPGALELLQDFATVRPWCECE